MRISDWSSDVCSSDLMGLAPIYQRPRTSDPHPRHRVYPYLLRKLAIERPNHVWCADVTYIPMRKGFLYLMAVMDWASRKVLAWRLSNRSEEHTSELQSLMRNSYAVFCLKKKKPNV